MPAYLTLVNWTQSGIEKVKESPHRLEAAKKTFQAAGGQMKEFYLPMGSYDMVVISEGPDDETAAKLALTIGSAGAIRTEALRAFTEVEYGQISADLP